MDNDTIETLAVSAVKDSIAISGFLSPFIADKDKEPSWDGQVYIYNSETKSKANIIGYVRVQSKGHECNDLAKEKIKHRVNVDDMRNYLNNGGIIYFVTYIKSNGMDRHIYYNTLTPIKLKRYLDEAKDQDTKIIEFKSFPSDNNRKCTIFLNFFNDSKKQTSFVNEGMLTIEDLQNSKDITGIRMSMSGYGQSKDQAFKAFFEDEVYLYATVKGTDALIPVEMMLSNLSATETLHWGVSVNSKKYYDTVSRKTTKSQKTIRIGHSLSLVTDDSNNLHQVKYHETPMLKNRIKDMEFFIDILENKHFYINDIMFEFNPSDEERKSFDIIKMKNYIHQGEKIIKVLETLNIKKDFNLDTLTEAEHMEIVNLIVAFVDEKPVPFLKKDLPTICRIDIQDIRILLIYQQLESESGIYQIQDFFKANLSVVYNLKDSEEKFVTSSYSIMEKDDFLRVDNINYSTIVPSYNTNLKHNTRIFEQANVDLLKMLSAYDEGLDTNKQLLELAKDMAEWIYNGDKDDQVPREVKMLNLMQIIRREREFNKEEKIKLITITESSIEREDVKTAAYLLLGNQYAAEIHFKKMDAEWQEGFKQYPIFRFWNGTEKDQSMIKTE